MFSGKAVACALALAAMSLLAASGPDSNAIASGSPGRLIAQSTAITGQQGKILLMLAAPASGGGTIAQACFPITSSPFNANAAYMTDMTGGDPCGGATPETVFQPGSYVGTEPVGDTNCDGLVNGQDIIEILKFGGGLAPYAACIESGNFICVDSVGPGDALYLAKRLAGLQAALGGGCPALLDAPVLVSPPDGTTFDLFPRTTTLEWGAVAEAAGYVVYVDVTGCDAPPENWCGDAGIGYLSFTGPALTVTFDFEGSQGGRWRVAAVGVDGRAGPLSQWRTFEHLQ
jgi:hypothetical protein